MLCTKICPHCLWNYICMQWQFLMCGLVKWNLTESRVFLWDVSPVIIVLNCSGSAVDITEGTPPVPAPLAIDGSLQVDLNDLSETNLIDYYCTATNSFGAARTVPFRAYSPCTYYVCLTLNNIYYFSLNSYPSLDIVDKVPVVLGQIAVLSCNPNVTRFFPKPSCSLVYQNNGRLHIHWRISHQSWK